MIAAGKKMLCQGKLIAMGTKLIGKVEKVEISTKTFVKKKMIAAKKKMLCQGKCVIFAIF